MIKIDKMKGGNIFLETVEFCKRNKTIFDEDLTLKNEKLK